MLRVVTAFVLFVFAAGVAVEACALATGPSGVPGGTPPTAEPTLVLPDAPARTPSGTIEVPPPID
jgi:hypothetical protein